MNELHKDDRKIREMLVDGPVDAEVSDDGKDWPSKRVIGYIHEGRYSFITHNGPNYLYARLPKPKEKRHWTAEEIMLHQGCFCLKGSVLVKVIFIHEDRVWFFRGPVAGGDGYVWFTIKSFCENATAVHPDGRREELYKEVEK